MNSKSVSGGPFKPQMGTNQVPFNQGVSTSAPIYPMSAGHPGGLGAQKSMAMPMAPNQIRGQGFGVAKPGTLQQQQNKRVPATKSGADGTAKRVTVWNKKEMRKVSGNAAPMEKNLHEYLRRHPECEVFTGQDSEMDPAAREARLAAEKRITIWNKAERRKFSGNAAPLEKNLMEYLRKHTECEVYNGQDKRPEDRGKSCWNGSNAGMQGSQRPNGTRWTGMHSKSATAHHSMGAGTSAMPIRASSGGHLLHQPEMRAVVESPFAVDPFSGMDAFNAGFMSMSGSPGWTSQIMDSPVTREGVPIATHQTDPMASFDDGAMAMSFGTNGAGSFNPSSLDSGAVGCSPHSLGGFFSNAIGDDSGYASKDTGSNVSNASQPKPINRPRGDSDVSSLAGSCEMGTSPAQRYKAERCGISIGEQRQRAGSMGQSPRAASFGKEMVFGSLSPDMLASLEDTPFTMGMDMEMD